MRLYGKGLENSSPSSYSLVEGNAYAIMYAKPRDNGLKPLLMVHEHLSRCFICFLVSVSDVTKKVTLEFVSYRFIFSSFF